MLPLEILKLICHSCFVTTNRMNDRWREKVKKTYHMNFVHVKHQ